MLPVCCERRDGGRVREREKERERKRERGGESERQIEKAYGREKER